MKPYIYLTFANNPNHAYLDYLREEWESLDDIYESLDSGIQLELEKKAEKRDLVNGFRKIGKQVVLFHFAGHAGQGDLLLEDSGFQGKSVADLIQAVGSEQLQLVFLNGCGTAGLVDRFLTNGAKAVLATSVSVGDRDALDFSKTFYKFLVTGYTLKSAFEAAKAALDKAEQKVTINYRDAGFAENTAGEFPWGLYLPAGSEAILDWELADAIRDYTIGLPRLPADIGLPNAPFKHLHYYTRADARVFFARSREIRKLYRMVTADTSSDITLLYGPTGVGKSSLLFAGLVPRLERDWGQPHYIRTDHLAELERLRSLTADLGSQPAIFIFDQLEELISRHPNQAATDMEAFLRVLDQWFAQLPRGQYKAILGFRKEYFAEIEGMLTRLGTSYEQLFLKPIDRAGIIQAIEGITVADDMQRKYNLTIEVSPPGTDKMQLSQRIADYILRDRQSNVGPVLQILLDKLWRKAKKENRSNPTFSYAYYEQLEAAGLTLQDYLNEVFQELSAAGTEDAERQSWWVETGLLLDLLHYFITSEETAGQHTRAAVHARYAHLAEKVLNPLIKFCKDRYLFTEPPQDAAGVERLRLSHDALAPVVRRLFESSERTGQQAWRILNAKAKYILQEAKSRRFDEFDIEVVEAGKLGMPDLEEVLKQKIATDSDFYQRQRQERYRLVLDTANHDVEHLQFTTVVNKLAIAAREALRLHDGEEEIRTVRTKALELVYPLTYLRLEQQLKEAVELIIDLPDESRPAWTALRNKLASLPKQHLFQEMEAWFRGKDEAWYERMQQRFIPNMVPIEGGRFPMGSNDPYVQRVYPSEKQEQIISIAKFDLADTPITCWQYGLYCLATGRELPKDAGFGRGDRPVIQVSWYEAIAYCNWLTEQFESATRVYQLDIPADPIELDSKKINWSAIVDWEATGFRLPTEAEWEYAAGGGAGERTLFGNGHDLANPEQMNFDFGHKHNEAAVKKKWMKLAHWTKEKFRGQTTPVKEFAANNSNSFGLNDMSGNVFEWCWDWYDDGYYKKSPEINPRGPESGKARVVRGGTWDEIALACRCSYRGAIKPSLRKDYTGFRVSRG